MDKEIHKVQFYKDIADNSGGIEAFIQKFYSEYAQKYKYTHSLDNRGKVHVTFYETAGFL